MDGYADESLGRLGMVDAAASGDVFRRCEATFSDWFAGHELATPLHAIRGSAELMLDGSLGRLSKEALEATTLIAEAARSLESRFALLARIERVRCGAAASLLPVRLLDLCPGLTAVPQAGVWTAPSLMEALIVEVCAAEIEDALALLVGAGPGAEAGQERDRPVLSAVEERGVTLALERAGAGLAAGEGAIAFELACQLVARSRGELKRGDGSRMLLTLPRARSTRSATGRT